MPRPIERLYAWIATTADGVDGIPAYTTPAGRMPMVGTDKERIEALRPMADGLAEDQGYRVRLVEFTRMVVLEEKPGRVGGGTALPIGKD